MPTSVHLIPAKMALHVLILMAVTAVIVNQDILATTVKQVCNFKTIFCSSVLKDSFCFYICQMLDNLQICTLVTLNSLCPLAYIEFIKS